MSERFQVSRQTIAAITAWTKIWAQRVCNKEASSEQGGTKVNSSKSHQIKVSPLSGAWVDFENSEIKEQWRQVEADFIDRHIDKDPAKRAQMRVLCTPGIKCYKEVQHLLSKGIRPENILAVEREKAAWGEFESNCRSVGIRPVFGDLQEILPHQVPFDIVCIDFLGQLCKANLRVLHTLPLKDRAIISLNMLAKRESAEIQEELSQLKMQYDGTHRSEQSRIQKELLRRPSVTTERSTTLQNATDAHLLHLAEETRRQTDRAISEKFEPVSEEVRDVTLWSAMRHAGALNEQQWKFNNMFTPFPFHPTDVAEGRTDSMNKYVILSRACTKIFGPDIHRVEAWLHAGKLLGDSELYYSWDALALCSHIGLRQITALEKYKYLSRVGKAPSPFFTNLAVVEKPKQLYQDVNASAAFLLQSVRQCMRDTASEIKSDYQFIFERYEMPLREHAVPCGTDRLAGMYIASGTARRCQRISVQALANDFLRFNSGMASYPLNDYHAVQQVERKAIT